MAEEKIMKTKDVGRFQTVTIVAGLLATRFAIAQKTNRRKP